MAATTVSFLVFLFIVAGGRAAIVRGSTWSRRTCQGVSFVSLKRATAATVGQGRTDQGQQRPVSHARGWVIRVPAVSYAAHGRG